MSLINQMLRDLEHRRTAEAGPSPLGGLSAAGSATQSVNFSINYTTLAIVMAVIFAAGVIVAYLLGSQQQTTWSANAVTATPEKDISMVVENVAASEEMQQKVLPERPAGKMPEQPALSEKMTDTAKATTQSIKPEKISAMLQPEPVAKEVPANDLVIEQASSVVIKPVEPAIKKDHTTKSPSAAEEDINKTIRPLTDEQQAQLAFQHAIKLLGRGNKQSALLTLADALTFLPTHTRARETQAALLLNEGRVSEAATSLREGLQLAPAATPLAKLYARILVDQGDNADAVTVLERARPAVSADPEYHALLAALYRQQKKFAQAAQVYQRILIQRPGVASWWMGLALAKDAMGEKAQALVAFQRAQRAGGLSAQVLDYVQSRIVALTPAVPVATNVADFDEIGE
jgi:MSHA biogenesis protein MshN